MKQTIDIDIYDFRRAFETMGRNKNFSYNGKAALFEYLEQYEEDCGHELELDVIAICCEYSEYDSILSAYLAYNDNIDPSEDMLEWLQDRTQTITFDGGIIIQSF